jgi:rhodanese-related sulfurtransferase/transcriptional regulator with XRE-family HTH domain
MVRTVRPKEAQALIAEGVDLVDVREPNEFASGYIGGARNVPLGQLRRDPRGALPRDRVLLVCARGVRSQTAAEVAEGAGLRDIFHLEGGMAAWGEAGLPTEEPARAAPAPRPSEATAEAADSICDVPEPTLDAAVGANIHALRTQRGQSLDELARLSGLSRTLLGQLELGKTPPSVSVLWKIAQAFNVHFSALLQTPQRLNTSVLRRGEAKRLVSPDGRFSSRALFPFSEKPDAEFYELFLAAHSREDAQPHQPGTRENLIVTAGRLELHVGGEQFDLERGDAIVFTADVPHSYVNPGSEECWMCLVMTYGGATS